MSLTLMSGRTVDESETALVSDIANNLTKPDVCEGKLRSEKQVSYRLQSAEITGIEGPCNPSCRWSKALKQERNAEGVETQVHEILTYGAEVSAEVVNNTVLHPHRYSLSRAMCSQFRGCQG